MNIVANYSFNGGLETVHKNYPDLLGELTECVTSIEASKFKTKKVKKRL